MEALLYIDSHKICWSLQLGNPVASRTHHEIIELGGAGHELRSAHSHTDLHEACVLAGFGLSHLAHDPVGTKGGPRESQDSQPWPRPTARPERLADLHELNK